MGSPFANWMKGALPEIAEEALSEGSLKAAGYFDAASVRGFLQEHRSGFRNHGRILMGILGVQVWDRVIRGMKSS